MKAVNALIFHLIKLFAMFPFLVCNVLKRTDHFVHVETACSSVKNLVQIWDDVSCQRSACFDCGLQGDEVSGDQNVASDLISRNCHRIHLRKFGVSTFLNVQETVSHACQLHSFSPVLHDGK